jgi:cysteine synthase A
MTAEELAIAQSTPHHRFDKEPDVPAKRSLAAAATPESEAFVREVLADSERPVVLFALTWCEFTWGVRKLFARCGIRYRAVDIDSVAYQKDNLGERIRSALNARAGVSTIPQVFVGGTLVGGAEETFAAFASGELQRLFTEHGVAFEDTVGDTLYSLMPGWAQKRQRA